MDHIKNMAKRVPRVSIGLPVYNGERFLSQALDSVLGQTFQDFELIISDNCSTDSTEALCRTYAAKDKRIHYFRNDANLGAAKNFNRTFSLSTGQYFQWLAADDAIAPECLARCVEALDEDQGAVLAYPRVTIVDEVKNERRKSDLHINVATSLTARDRLEDLLLNAPPSSVVKFFIFGMIRSEALRRTPLIRSCVGSDVCLLVDLVLLGKFVAVPEYLLELRWHPESYSYTLQVDRRASGVDGSRQSQWFDTVRKPKVILPHWRFLWEHSLTVVKSSEGLRDKLLMFGTLCRSAGRQKEILKRELNVATINAMTHTPFAGIARLLGLALALAFHSAIVVMEAIFRIGRWIVRLPRRWAN